LHTAFYHHLAKQLNFLAICLVNLECCSKTGIQIPGIITDWKTGSPKRLGFGLHNIANCYLTDKPLNQS